MNQDLVFKQLQQKDPVPYDLLILADPSKDMIDGYLKHARIFLAQEKGEVLGVIVLLGLSEELAEIKNMAVKPAFQGQGIGKYLIERTVEVASLNHYKSICIGTANSSVRQLYLYQKLGFELSGVKWDFFTKNYPQPIYEKGIQSKHQLVLTKEL